MNTHGDWNLLLSFLPDGWEASAVQHGAWTRRRGFDSPEALLRTLLIHLAQGCSLRETAVRARRGGVASVSDVALLKRLRKSESWLHDLCRGLCEAAPMPIVRLSKRWRLTAVDATHISEPGSTGTNWRLHYALDLPSLACTHFELTGPSGAESFERFPLRRGDLVLADRAYCKVGDIRRVLRRGAHVLVRMKLSQNNFYVGEPLARFDFLEAASDLEPDQAIDWRGALMDKSGSGSVPGRLCLVRRPDEVADMARRKILREAKKKGRRVRARTLRAAAYVGVFCTAPQPDLSAQDLLAIYRFRWQIELAFKRLKSITNFGHLPKRDPTSCRAWLYGKLLLGLLVERMAQAPFFP